MAPKHKYTPPAQYSADELRDFEIIDLRVDHASAMTRADRITDGSGVTDRHNEATELRKYARGLAHTIAIKLGHTLLRQGDAAECAKCGASGTTTRLLNGDVFWHPCGLPIDGGFALFGKEATTEQCARRARFERGCARELRAGISARGHNIGDEELAAGHEKAALAYEARARELREANKPIRFVVSDTVASVMMLDDLNGDRGEAYGVKLADEQPKRGTAVEGTREGLQKFAQYLIDTPDTCDDAPKSAQRACVDAGERLRKQLGGAS